MIPQTSIPLTYPILLQARQEKEKEEKKKNRGCAPPPTTMYVLICMYFLGASQNLKKKNPLAR